MSWEIILILIGGTAISFWQIENGYQDMKKKKAGDTRAMPHWYYVQGIGGLILLMILLLNLLGF